MSESALIKSLQAFVIDVTLVAEENEKLKKEVASLRARLDESKKKQLQMLEMLKRKPDSDMGD